MSRKISFVGEMRGNTVTLPRGWSVQHLIGPSRTMRERAGEILAREPDEDISFREMNRAIMLCAAQAVFGSHRRLEPEPRPLTMGEFLLPPRRRRWRRWIAYAAVGFAGVAAWMVLA